MGTKTKVRRSTSQERRAKLSVASATGNENRTYKPSASELNKEINVILAGQETLDWRPVYRKLEQKHKTWVLHDRRVAKYVKRQNNKKKQQAFDQASPSGVGSWDRFFRHKSNGAKQSQSPRIRSVESPHIRSVELVNMGQEVPMTPLETPSIIMTTTEKSPSKTATPQTMSPVVRNLVESLKDIYADDNKGDKESGCLPCAAIKSCTAEREN